METFAECNGIKLRGVYDDSKYNRKNVSRYIKNGLINNKPVAMLIGVNSELDNTVLKVSTWGRYAYLDLDSFIDGEYIYECLMYFE